MKECANCHLFYLASLRSATIPAEAMPICLLNPMNFIGTDEQSYALVWDQPRSEADYPGEILQWIDAIEK